MFTPQNFYDTIFLNHVRSTQDILYVPQKNGAKKLEDFIAYSSIPHINFNDLPFRKLWIMYDQEPLMDNIMQELRSKILAYTFEDQQRIVHALPDEALMAIFWKTWSLPLWCHSQFGSSKIQRLQDHNFSCCYYWYHAFIARDWYRHWQYHNELLPQDKSQSSDRFLLYSRDHSGTRAYRQDLVRQLEPIRSTVKYDWSNQRIITAEFSAKITSEDSAAGIQLVAETLFNDDSLYLTEKIFRPMVMSQPFMVFAPPGTLALLHRYGFQTFASIWDETYDSETDHERRMAKILLQVYDIANMSQCRYQDLYRRCLPIIAHNRERFYSEDFMTYCWQELECNMKNAVMQRDQMSVAMPGGLLCYVLNRYQELLQIPIMRAMARNLLKKLDADLLDKISKQYPIFSGL